MMSPPLVYSWYTYFNFLVVPILARSVQYLPGLYAGLKQSAQAGQEFSWLEPAGQNLPGRLDRLVGPSANAYYAGWTI